MAESKKTSGARSKAETRAELAETLKRAAELTAALEGDEAQPPAAKKPAAKKPPTKKPETKTATSKTGGAKKSAAKPAAAKTKPAATEEPQQPKQEEIVKTEEPHQEEIANTTPAAEAAEIPAATEQAVTEPAAPDQPKKEEIAAAEEKPQEEIANTTPAAEAAEAPAAAEQTAVEPEPAATEQQAVAEAPTATVKQPKKTDAFINKSSDFINNKGKFPLWIVANSLLLLGAIFLIIGAFNLSYNIDGVKGTISASVFQYFGNKATIVGVWQGTAGSWANGGFTMIGILMLLSIFVPIALIAKNVVLFILKKDKNVHMLDALVAFAFLIAYLGVVNMYGANMTWAHILSLIMSIVLLAYTIFVILIENREGAFPFYSIANLVMIIIVMFLLTATPVYSGAPGWYAAHSAAFSVGGGFAFIMLLIALVALVLLVIMQVKKLPGKIEYFCEFIVPAVAGVFALIALISFAGGKPKGLFMGGGFVFGSILTLLFAAADVVIALVPKLHKFDVKVTDRMPTQAAKPVAVQPQAAAATEIATEQAEQQPVEQKTEVPATPQKNVCVCGMENEPDAVFCLRCGRKLK